MENLDLNGRILLTNADNYYTPNLVEEILKYDEDFIYFNVVHSHRNKNNHNKNINGKNNRNIRFAIFDFDALAIFIIYIDIYLSIHLN